MQQHLTTPTLKQFFFTLKIPPTTKGLRPDPLGYENPKV